METQDKAPHSVFELQCRCKRNKIILVWSIDTISEESERERKVRAEEEKPYHTYKQQKKPQHYTPQ